MKANTATNFGIYLGKGINPFPNLHAFAKTSNGANKSFVDSLNGVIEISLEEFIAKENAIAEAKESFYSVFTA